MENVIVQDYIAIFLAHKNCHYCFSFALYGPLIFVNMQEGWRGLIMFSVCFRNVRKLLTYKHYAYCHSLYVVLLCGMYVNQRRLYNDYPTCSKRHGRLEHVG